MGATFRRIASEGSRRNFRSFNFHGAHMHGEARRYRYSASGNFHGFYFCGSRPIRENREILHHAKISPYMVAQRLLLACLCTAMYCGSEHIVHVHVHVCVNLPIFVGTLCIKY